MSLHRFDPEIAETVGVNAAVLFENLCHWTRKNQANGRHLYEGKYWTYNSLSAFCDLFPYLSMDQIRTAIKKLEDGDYIERGNFNKSSYDRTTWYCVKSLIHLGKSKNGSGENPKTYKEQIINTDNKPDSKPREAVKGDYENLIESLEGLLPPEKRNPMSDGGHFLRVCKKHNANDVIEAVKRFYSAPGIKGNEARFIPKLTTVLIEERFLPFLPANQSGKPKFTQARNVTEARSRAEAFIAGRWQTAWGDEPCPLTKSLIQKAEGAAA